MADYDFTRADGRARYLIDLDLAADPGSTADPVVGDAETAEATVRWANDNGRTTFRTSRHGLAERTVEDYGWPPRPWTPPGATDAERWDYQVDLLERGITNE